MDDLVTTDTILGFLKDEVQSKRALNPDIWLDSAFKLNLLLADEHTELENLRLLIAKKKLSILERQEKRNVSAADLEIEASEEHRAYKLQEHKVGRIEEFIKIAKKNATQF
jgi:hypothetical protein